eukprot:15194025-Alexandrium_andersonii.AAC.1
MKRPGCTQMPHTSRKPTPLGPASVLDVRQVRNHWDGQRRCCPHPRGRFPWKLFPSFVLLRG